MKTVRMKVQGGKLIGEAPAMLREGAIVDVVIADRDDDMSSEELATLNDELDASWVELESGNVVSADDAIAAVRAVRSAR